MSYAQVNDGEDEEATLYLSQSHSQAESGARGFSYRFWVSAGINVVSTVTLVFVNKFIFETESLRHAQVSFAAFHFAITGGLLYILSRPAINTFQAKRVSITQIFLLALAMIMNVVLQNAALANSSIQFYQVVRALLTPSVALLNFVLIQTTISVRAMLTLVPVCVGVAAVSYFDTMPSSDQESTGTAPIGVVLALTGILVSSVYTVMIGKYHRMLNCTSQQLLLNQAPVSVLMMLFIIPFTDNVTALAATPPRTWLLILFSGVLACLLNVSQFIVIDEGGTVTSTVVGHFKLCCGIILGWLYTGKSLKDGSVVGLVLVIGGIISYGVVTHKELR